MIRSAWAYPIGLVVAAIAACTVTVIETPTPVRALVIFGFIGLCPGLGLVGLIHITDWTQRLVLGIVTSLAIATVVTSISLYAGYWSPTAILLILVAITLLGVVLQLPRPSLLTTRRNDDPA